MSRPRQNYPSSTCRSVVLVLVVLVPPIHYGMLVFIIHVPLWYCCCSSSSRCSRYRHHHCVSSSSLLLLLTPYCTPSISVSVQGLRHLFRLPIVGLFLPMHHASSNMLLCCVLHWENIHEKESSSRRVTLSRVDILRIESNPSKLRQQTPPLFCHTPHPSMLRRMTMTMIRMPRTTTYLYWPGVHCVVYVVVVLVTSSYSLSVLFMFDTCTTCTYIYQHVVPSYPIAITGVGEQVPGNLRSLARPRRPKRPHPKRTPTPWRASRQPSRNRRATRLRGSCRTNRIIFLLKIKRGSGGI